MSNELVFDRDEAPRNGAREFTASAIATTAIIALGCWLAVYWQPPRDAAAEAELNAFEASVTLGDSVDAVREKFTTGAYPHLTWVSTFYPYFVVKTPPRAGVCASCASCAAASGRTRATSREALNTPWRH